jgi:hypothetical protein
LSKNRATALEHPLLTSKVMTQIYFKDEVDPEDLDRLMQIRFGMNMETLLNTMAKIEKVLSIRFNQAVEFLVDSDKVSSKLQPIGQVTRSRPTHEELKTFNYTRREERKQKVQQDIDDYTKQISDITLTMEYASEVSRYEGQLEMEKRRLANQEVLTQQVERQLQREYRRAIGIVKQRYGILDLEENLQNAREELKEIEQIEFGKQASFDKWQGYLTIVMLSVAGYFLFRKCTSLVTSTEYYETKHFQELRKETKYDPMMVRLISDYVKDKKNAPELLGADSAKVLSDFQVWVNVKAQDLSLGRTKYEELYGENGLASVLLSSVHHNQAGTAVKKESWLEWFKTPFKRKPAINSGDNNEVTDPNRPPKTDRELLEGAREYGLDFVTNANTVSDRDIATLKNGVRNLGQATEQNKQAAVYVVGDIMQKYVVVVTKSVYEVQKRHMASQVKIPIISTLVEGI